MRGKTTFHIRWKLFFYDVIVFAVTSVFLLVLYEGPVKLTQRGELQQMLLAFVCVFACRLVGKIYGQIWRYGGIQCYMRLVCTDCVAFLIYVILEAVLPVAHISFPRLLALSTVNTMGALIMRMSYRYAYKCSNLETFSGKILAALLKIFAGIEVGETRDDQKIKVAIIGAGNVGVSRNNRASAQRIRSLVVQAPETKIQKNIIDELKALDDKINGQNAEIEKYENSIRTKFDQIFHLEEFISDGVFSKYEGYSVEDLCIDGRGRVINQQYIENHKGPYPVYSSQTTNDGIFGSIDTFDFDGEYITWTTDGAKAGTVFYRNGKFNCTNVCGTLKAKNDKVNMRYLAYLLNRIAYKFVSRVGNNKLMNDAMKKIVVPVPKRQLQDEFADFVQSVEKSKFECIGKKEKFEIEKDTFVHKYFR